MKKISYFIDGFNLYHALLKLDDRKLKWLNLKSLCEHWVPKTTCKLQDIFFFTALPKWNEEKTKRHFMYINALQSTGVKIVEGRFKKVTRTCRNNCGYHTKKYETHEEKETDVNVAIYLLEKAVTETYDEARIISADSDLIPAIKSVKRLYPQKSVKVILPPSKKDNYKGSSLIKSADSHQKIKKMDLYSHLFPEIVTYKGREINSPYF